MHVAGNWVKIAAYVGHGVDRVQCRVHWTRMIEPALARLEKGAWSDDEVRCAKSSTLILFCLIESLSHSRKAALNASITDSFLHWDASLDVRTVSGAAPAGVCGAVYESSRAGWRAPHDTVAGCCCCIGST